MSFKTELLLFVIGCVGLGLAIFIELPEHWTLISFGIGLGAWLLSALWKFVGRTLALKGQFKRARDIHEAHKQERAEEADQVIRSGPSHANNRAFRKRLSLMADAFFGAAR